jgi:membrane protein YqaA with SNARE-associated domain
MLESPMLELFLDWRLWSLVIFLTAITVVTSVAKYRLGRNGLETLKEHYPQVSDERWRTIDNYFQRWGAPVVLFSFLPLLAWIIPPAAGAYGIRFRTFLVWAFMAKMVRYWILILIVIGGYQLIF